MTARCTSRLARFLATTRKVSTASTSGLPVTVVIGNEAADLDSVVSAVSYAFLESTRQERRAAGPVTEYLPVVGIPRADFALRTECPYALNTGYPDTDITPHLTFLDEIDLDALHSASRLRLVLVDHNQLAPSLRRFETSVVGILDHHVDEGLHPEADPRVIEPVGSAATLVAEQWKLAAADDVQPESGLALCMICAILIDTVNLKEEYGRVTKADRRAVDYLLPFARAGEHSVASTAVGDDAFLTNLYQGVYHAKVSISNLSSYDLLRKDYKEWLVGSHKLGISSVSWHISGADGWAAREGSPPSSPKTRSDGKDAQTQGSKHLRRACESFATSRNLDCHVVMTAFNHENSATSPEKGFERELFVTVYRQLATDADARARLLKGLEASPLLDLKIVAEKWCEGLAGPEGAEGDKHQARLYLQKNIRSSRKQVQPIMEGLLNHL
ncbi:hypothetical protein HKX48_008604 [Thoreauomyces humboldtii]|nr:hypothetical protein HKX48_008604 [Thoreauomyces humboldtii]